MNKLGNDDDKFTIFVLSLPFFSAVVCKGVLSESSSLAHKPSGAKYD
jgi:hypothetical protein